MSFTRLIRPLMFVAAMAAVPVSLYAQAAPATQTATQFYMAYRAAFDKATKYEDLYPYLAAATVKQIQAASATERTQNFGLMKMMGTLKDIKVTKETAKGTGATLTAEGIDPDSNKKQAGTIHIIKESGAFKIGDESWQ